MNRSPAGEVDAHEADTVIELEVPKGLEHAVAGVVRKREVWVSPFF